MALQTVFLNPLNFHAIFRLHFLNGFQTPLTRSTRFTLVVSSFNQSLSSLFPNPHPAQPLSAPAKSKPPRKARCRAETVQLRNTALSMIVTVSDAILTPCFLSHSSSFSTFSRSGIVLAASPAACKSTYLGADIMQPQSTEFLHNVALKSERSDFCIFLGGTKCGHENNEKVSSDTSNHKPYSNLGRLLGILEEKSIHRGIIVFP